MSFFGTVRWTRGTSSLHPIRQHRSGRINSAAPSGGPIAKSKTFFFLNYDGQRIRDSLTQLFSVPTAAQRSGALMVRPS